MPRTVTPKDAVPPAVAVTLTGCTTMNGGSEGTSTVSRAGELVTEPSALLTVTV